MRVQVIEDVEIADLLTRSGNYDDLIVREKDQFYVRYGVNKVWVSHVSGSRKYLYIVQVSNVGTVRREIKRLVEKLLEIVRQNRHLT